MLKHLLQADFYKLIRLKSFYVITVLMACFAWLILTDLSMYPDSYRSEYDHFLHVTLWPFEVWQFMPMIMPLGLGIVLCLFVTNEYTYGTIKDPVVLGHSRLNVFLAKCITACIAAVIMMLVCVLVSIGTSLLLFDGLVGLPDFQDSMLFLLRILLMVGLTIALAVLFTTIAFIIRSTAIVMAVHFSVGLFVTIIIGTLFPPESSMFYAWPASAMALVSGALSLEMIGLIIAVIVIYMLVSITVGYVVFAKRDMK